MKPPRTIAPELMAALKRLRLGGILPTLPERIALSEKDSTPLDELLLVLLVDEIERRKSTAARRRAEVTGLDPDMIVERWDKTAKVHFDNRRGRTQRRGMKGVCLHDTRRSFEHERAPPRLDRVGAHEGDRAHHPEHLPPVQRRG